MVRMALVMLIYNFDFEILDEELEFLHKGLFITDTNNIHMRVKKRVGVEKVEL